MIYSHQSGDSPLKFSLGGGGAYFTVQELAEPGDAETWFLGAAGEAEVERRLIKRIPIVVYHVAAMGDWQDVVREQLRLIRDVGLGAEVRCTHVGGGLDWLLAEAKACDVNLVIVRSDPNTDHYETFAILEIERLARVENTDRNILYMHTKGVSAPGHAGKHSWRRAMEEYVVRLWRRNVETLGDGSGYDAIGLNWQQHSQQHFSGNFWIARPDWIRRLPDFVTYHHALQCVRYSCEFWIGAMEWCRAYSLACAECSTPCGVIVVGTAVLVSSKQANAFYTSFQGWQSRLSQ